MFVYEIPKLSQIKMYNDPVDKIFLRKRVACPFLLSIPEKSFFLRTGLFFIYIPILLYIPYMKNTIRKKKEEMARYIMYIGKTLWKTRQGFFTITLEKPIELRGM